ncbi:MAG: glycosyltransferase family 9 protein [Cystobacterineae bacterium]|nr:glycosyltransferase family 9 protein [Cystobacterineae bacterium]
MRKWPELWAKNFAGNLAAALLWRPQRRLRAQNLGRIAKVLLVRVDNRVGEALLLTPLLEALAPYAQTDVLVHTKTARVLEGHPLISQLIPLHTHSLRLGPLSRDIAQLRKYRWDAVVNCTNWSAPSVSASLLARWVAPHAPVIGPACGVAKTLADIAVPPRENCCAEVLQRLHLLHPLGLPLRENYGLSFRKPRLSLPFQTWLSKTASQPLAVLNPGARLSHRRVPQEVFVRLCQALLSLGRIPLVTWGPGEQTLAAQLVQAAPGSVLAPPTNLDELAALMQRAQCSVCNNTGPMHLSVAMGAPTLSLFYKMPMQRWGHHHPPHLCVDLGPLEDNPKAMAQLAVQALGRFLAALPQLPPQGG